MFLEVEAYRGHIPLWLSVQLSSTAPPHQLKSEITVCTTVLAWIFKYNERERQLSVQPSLHSKSFCIPLGDTGRTGPVLSISSSCAFFVDWLRWSFEVYDKWTTTTESFSSFRLNCLYNCPRPSSLTLKTMRETAEAQFIVPDWGDKVDYGIMGLTYRPVRRHRLAGRYDYPRPLSTSSPSKGLWIWLLYCRNVSADYVLFSCEQFSLCRMWFDGIEIAWNAVYGVVEKICLYIGFCTQRITLRRHLKEIVKRVVCFYSWHLRGLFISMPICALYI